MKTLVLFFLSLLSLSGIAQSLSNCNQILSSDPAATSGVYTIDPDGPGSLPAMNCYCDMTTDGGGWTLVLNYNHLAATYPSLHLFTDSLPLQNNITLGFNESNSQFWGHADNALLSAIPFDEIRFLGITSNHSRTIHFKTSHLGTVSYFKTGLGSTSGISSSFSAFPDHTAFLPATIDFTVSDQGDYAMTNYPLWTGSAYHWYIGGVDANCTAIRWEVDDYPCSSIPSTFHQIWIRNCTAQSSTDVHTACDSFTWIDGNTYTSSNNTATHTITNAANCDSVVTLDLTITSIETSVSQNDIILTADMAGASYQWLSCDNGYSIIPGETSQNYTASANGNYAVEITNNGCTDTSACYLITTIGIVENNFGNDFLQYPNPTDGYFTIDLGEKYEVITVTIKDLKGSLIQSKTYTQCQLLNLEIEESSGVYILVIESGNRKAVIRLVNE